MTSARSNGYARSAKTRVPLGPSTLFFFFFPWNRVYSDFKRDLFNAACLLFYRSPAVSLRGKKIGIYLSTMYNFFPPPPRICPRSLIFHDETIFEGDETRRAQSPGKGLKFNDTNLRRGINLSFSNFSVLLLGQGFAMYDPLIFNLLLKISFTSPSLVYKLVRLRENTGPSFPFSSFYAPSCTPVHRVISTPPLRISSTGGTSYVLNAPTAKLWEFPFSNCINVPFREITSFHSTLEISTRLRPGFAKVCKITSRIFLECLQDGKGLSSAT